MPWLTGGQPVGTTILSIELPAAAAIRQAAVGALAQLCYDYNWSDFGSETSADTAYAIAQLFNTLAFDASTSGGEAVTDIQVRRTSNQAAFANVWTQLDFTSEIANSGEYSLANDTFTASVAGTYLFQVYIHVNGGANKIALRIQKADVVVYERGLLGLSNAPHHHIFTVMLRLDVGDSLVFWGMQSTLSEFVCDATYPMELTAWRL